MVQCHRRRCIGTVDVVVTVYRTAVCTAVGAAATGGMVTKGAAVGAAATEGMVTKGAAVGAAATGACKINVA